MSCCPPVRHQDESSTRNKLIEEDLKMLKKKKQTNVKILLLGAGDSGKSTFVKQIKQMHNGFSKMDTDKYQSVLQDNCLVAMQQILDRVPIPKSFRKEKEDVLASDLLNQCVLSVVTLWECKEIRTAYENRSRLNLQIPSSSNYYFDNAERFANENFQPIPEDMFRAKLKTTGITEFELDHKGLTLTIIDVGGQRSERRKWIHSFEDVTSIIFLAALDEYDMCLDEDHNTNRLEESLRLFEEITTSNVFQPLSWILFLNKTDLFEEKIKTIPLSDYFTEISKEDSKKYEMCYDFIHSLYKKRFKGKNLYSYPTCAIDSEKCSQVFVAIRDSIISEDLNSAGFL
jgi:GTPase SAR1 family protein